MPADTWACVVDASALAAVLFGEPGSDEVARRLEGRALVAPALLRFELANICWKKARRHPDERKRILAAHTLADGLEIHEVEVRFADVVELADRENLTAYDASYLWLSQVLDLELVTLDRALSRVAENLEA
jgi:predicted nucleic acid-binding protein